MPIKKADYRTDSLIAMFGREAVREARELFNNYVRQNCHEEEEFYAVRDDLGNKINVTLNLVGNVLIGHIGGHLLNKTLNVRR